MLGELEGEGRIAIADLEAGVGAVVRAGHADVVLIVAEPTVKSIDVARRALETSAGVRTIVIANRVSDEADIEAIRAALPGHELVAVPDDATIARADRDGVAPLDLDPHAPGVRALRELAGRLSAA